MCYLVFISTDADQELSSPNSSLVNFEKNLGDYESEIVNSLQYSQKWYVASKSGCSCSFRHLFSIELGFGEPVDWYKEESDDIEATKAFYDLVVNLLSAGNQVDCISIWEGTKIDQIKHLEVDLSSISRESFRFFENHHFSFKSS
jgi:hypothetical protein